MHCECCDKLLDNEESTARFFNEDRKAPARYVNMCRGCRSFLPPEVRIITRHDFVEDESDQAELEEKDDEHEEE